MTPCARCGAQHDPGVSPCAEASLVGRTLHAGIRVRERLWDTPLGPLYRAEYPTGLEVAVLLLSSTSDPAGLALLRQRCQDAIRIQHPNVAAIHSLSETDDGLVYVVAEFLTGELLSEILAKRGALLLEDAVDLCLQAAAGLQAAHENGWVHGRLSPDTILVTRKIGHRPVVKVIGFSQDPLLRRDATPPMEGGSLKYASPERIAGDPPDEQGDVYSLAAILHQLLAGVPPTLPLQGVAGPQAMRPVLVRALAPLPGQRFQTVAEFVAALAPLGQPVVNPLPEPTRAARRKFLGDLWPEQRIVAAVLAAVFAGLSLLWFTYKPGPDPPRETGLGESASAAERESDSISSSSSSAASVPARLRRKSAPTSQVRREPVTGRVPTPSVLPPASSSNAGSDSILIDVRSSDPTIQTDLRYATSNNFTGAPLPGYEAPRALLRAKAAAALSRVQATLREKGLGLRVLDAYRPVRASRAMVEWAERTGNQSLVKKGYIPERSRHNLGASVDVTLVDLATGTEVIPTTAFDNFTGTPDTANATAQLRYRRLLLQAMESEGFNQFGRSWWHFNYPAEGAVPLDRVIR